MSAQFVKVQIVGEGHGAQAGSRNEVYLSISSILTMKRAGQAGDAYSFTLKPEYETAIIKKYCGGNGKIESIGGQIPKAVMDDLLGLGKVSPPVEGQQ